MEKWAKNNVLKKLTAVVVFSRTCFYKVIKFYGFRMREETNINTEQFTWGSLKRRWQVSALLRMLANTNQEKPKAVSLKIGGQGPCSSFLYSDLPISSRKPPAALAATPPIPRGSDLLLRPNPAWWHFPFFLPVGILGLEILVQNNLLRICTRQPCARFGWREKATAEMESEATAPLLWELTAQPWPRPRLIWPSE